VRIPLVALDFGAGKATRYWPKPSGAGFLTQEGSLRKPDDEPWQLGSEDGRRLIEDFRIGRLAVTALDSEPQAA
jgi:hypothetical protein